MMELLFALICSNVSVSAPLTLLPTLSFNATIYLYGISNGAPCLRMKSFLEGLEIYGVKVIWVPLDKVRPNVTKPLDIVTSMGLPLEVPLSAVYQNDTLKAIVIGDIENITFWNEILSSKWKGVRVYLGQKLIGTWSGKRVSFPFTALGLAIIDGLGPIALMVFALYLALCREVVGNCWGRALAFIATASVTRAVMGLTLSSLPVSPYYPAIGAILAFIILVNTLKPSKTVSKAINRFVSFFEKLVKNQASPFLLGLAVGSLGLSPCVVGAFLSASALASTLPFEQRLAFWALYAIVYSIPLALAAKVIEKVELRKAIAVLASISLLISLYFLATLLR